jgi:MraZ protein
VLLTGQSEHSIDSKLRLAIAAKHRDQLGEAGKVWYCVPWPGGILRLYPETIFEKLSAQLDDSLMPSGDQAERDAMFFSQAERLEADAQGRIGLPKEHVLLAGLKSAESSASTFDVVVIGVKNRLEVRGKEAWNASKMERFAGLSTLAERVEARKAAGMRPPASAGG